MMKFFTIIWCIYILMLSGLPCGDTDECITNDGLTISSPTNHHSHVDNCTPFCSCVCCTASAFYQTLSLFKTPVEIFLPFKFQVVNLTCKSKNFHAIWQPPKIS